MARFECVTRVIIVARIADALATIVERVRGNRRHLAVCLVENAARREKQIFAVSTVGRCYR